MANHPSAEKRNRQSVKRTLRSKGIRSATRTAVKKAREAIATGELEDAKEKVKAASVALARAAKRGVLHSRTASRVTSRINGALSKLG
jgi:small subunit ribosomal protein S20